MFNCPMGDGPIQTARGCASPDTTPYLGCRARKFSRFPVVVLWFSLVAAGITGVGLGVQHASAEGFREQNPAGLRIGIGGATNVRSNSDWNFPNGASFATSALGGRIDGPLPNPTTPFCNSDSSFGKQALRTDNDPGSRDSVTGPGSTRPNIVFFLVDDMGVMDTSVPFLTDREGNPKRYPLNDFFKTPNMERLASTGTRFNQFMAMSVCSPTRIALLTGQTSARHRSTNWINPTTNNRGPSGPREWRWAGLDSQSVTLPRMLQSSGYRTIHIGKAHFGPTPHPGGEPRNLGFDVNIGGSAIGHPGSYYGQKKYGAGGTHAVPHLDAYHDTDTFLTEALTNEALKQVDVAIQQNQPFFLNLCHYAVHSPFQSDPRFADEYRESGKPAPAQAFATLIAGMDHSLGRLLDHLQEKGVAENTLIVFMGDNGTDLPVGKEHVVACAAPLRGKKGTHYEGGMRAPLIVSWAKPAADSSHQTELPVRAGHTHNQLVSVCDLFPTILELVHLEKPAEHAIDGHSLTSLLAGSSDSGRPAEFLMHYPHQHRSSYFTVWREDRWKLIYHYFPDAQSEGQRYQLFDLENDPFESANVALQFPDRVREMMERMVQKLDSMDAQFPEGSQGQVVRPTIPE